MSHEGPVGRSRHFAPVVRMIQPTGRVTERQNDIAAMIEAKLDDANYSYSRGVGKSPNNLYLDVELKDARPGSSSLGHVIVYSDGSVSAPTEIMRLI